MRCGSAWTPPMGLPPRIPGAPGSGIDRMATIALCVWPLAGNIGGPLTLAKRLRERGHAVCVISIPDAASMVRAAGLPFEPLFAEMFPPGFLLDLRKRFATLSLFARLREMRIWTQRYEALIDAVVAGRNPEIEAVLDRVAPALVLVSTSIPYTAIVGLLALKRGIPFAYVTSLFSHYMDPANPPLSSRCIPKRGPIGRLQLRLLWWHFLISKQIQQRLIIALGLDIDISRVLRRLAASTHLANSGLQWRSFVAPLVPAPEFFFKPAGLDFPVSLQPDSFRLGLAPATQPTGIPFPWDRLDPRRKLLLCSLGTLLYLPLSRQREMLQAVVDAAEARPEWQLVIATGPYVDPDELHVRAPTAIVLQHVPQTEVLQRARLMVTHGGANSVHECAYFGVPMAVFPIGFDHPGCAARVVYHGLGLRGDVRRATADDIGRLIDAVAADRAMSDRCAAMAVRLREAARDQTGLQALDALAGGS
jgi:zeaxanthin glucosyltransferase